eukprot:scaffold35363_cov101-Isochrysis_galbana.AAC.1
MRALSGRPSVLMSTCTLSTDDSNGWEVHVVGDHVRGKRKLDVANVADGHGVGSSGGLDDRAEGPLLPILDVHPHLVRCVVRPVPQLNVGVEWAALRAQLHLHLLDGGRPVRPGAERPALDQDGGVCLDGRLGRVAGAGDWNREVVLAAARDIDWRGLGDLVGQLYHRRRPQTHSRHAGQPPQLKPLACCQQEARQHRSGRSEVAEAALGRALPVGWRPAITGFPRPVMF